MNQAFNVWVLLSLIWGSTWIFIKVGLRDLPPLTFAGLRFLVAALILWLYIFLRRQPLPRGFRQWGWIAASSAAFTFNYGLLFWGEQHISSGLTAVLQATIPAFGFLLAHYFIPGERITAAKLTGLGICTLGIAFIFSDQLKLEGQGALAGCAGVVIGSFAAAGSNIIVKRYCQSVSPASLAAAQMTVGLIPLLALGGWFETNLLKIQWTSNALICLLYLATIGSAVAFMLYYWLLQHTEVTRTLLISLITPVIAVIIGMLVLKEELTWRLAIGTSAVLLGLGMIVFPRAATAATA